MTRAPSKTGVTLVELLVVVAISAIVMTMVLRSARFFQTLMAFQMRLDRMSRVLDLTQEISQTVQSARRVISVEPDHLDLEVYDFADYDLLDPRLYQHTKRVRYGYQTEPPAIVREVYASTEAVKPDNSMAFLSNADLAPPDDAEPYFFASYLVADSTVGVRVAIRIHRPYSKDRWTPVKNEVYVRAE